MMLRTKNSRKRAPHRRSRDCSEMRRPTRKRRMTTWLVVENERILQMIRVTALHLHHGVEAEAAAGLVSRLPPWMATTPKNPSEILHQFKRDKEAQVPDIVPAVVVLFLAAEAPLVLLLEIADGNFWPTYACCKFFFLISLFNPLARFRGVSAVLPGDWFRDIQWN